MEGMNANTSILNPDSPLYVPPDSMPMVLSTSDKAKAAPMSFKFNNDDHIGHGPQPVQNAFAISSNTAFTDLAHRVGTKNIINMAQQMGVNIASFPAGSGLSDLVGQVGMALGTGALTVGIFTQQQADFLDKARTKPNTQTLNNLGGNNQGGFGGYWPARIWNTFAEAEFAGLQRDNFLTPVFTGSKWVQVQPKPRKK